MRSFNFFMAIAAFGCTLLNFGRWYAGEVPGNEAYAQIAILFAAIFVSYLERIGKVA